MSLNPQATRAAARAAEHGASSAVAGLAAATSRIASHGRAGDAAAARAVFDAMPRRDAVAWNAMLTAYARAGRPRAALALFAEMGAPDAFSLTAALSSAASLRCPDAGAQLHARLLRLGLRAPLPVGNALVAMYARCARADDAARAFREMRDRNALSWCSLLHAYVASGRMALARELFDEMPAGSISSVAWNTLLTGYSRSGNAKQCLLLFNEMRMSGLSCDGATLCILIGACMELPHPSTGFLVHKIVVQSVWSAIPEVNNSLISFYSKFSLLDHAVKIFKSMESRTVVSWNSLIDAYTRLGHIEQAAALFQSAPETNAISWTSMIGGFARNGFADEALALFVKMLTHEHIRPDDFTFGAVLHACATAASLASGRMIHGCALQSGYASYLYVANSLMDMYARCGDVEGASNVFHAVLKKDTVSWNTMLFGFAINGWAKEAFAVYERMLSRDICPDEVTFTGLLTACSHSGLVEQGRTFFESMVSVHGLKPTPEHLACVLDMYARSGNIVKAIEMLDQYSEMVHMHSSDMHESLLSAYSSVHLDARIGRKVGSSMVSMEPVRDTGYVMLSNMLCATGQWKEAEVVRRAMAEHGVKKSPGCSWIQLKGDAKVFVSGVLLETDSPGLGKKKGPVLPSSLTQELQTSKETHLWAPIHTMKGGGCAGGLSAARSTGRGWWCIMRWAASVVCLGRGIWLRCRWLRFLHRRCLFCWAASVLRGHFRLGDSSAVRLLALLLKATNNYTFLSLVETEKQLLLLLRVSRSIGQHLYLVITLMLKLPMIGCFGYQCRPLYQRIQSRAVHVASTDTVGRIQKLFLN